MVVREGTNVSLICKARGYPDPYVMWRREDGDEMSIAGENGMTLYFVVVVVILTVYLCVSSSKWAFKIIY